MVQRFSRYKKKLSWRIFPPRQLLSRLNFILQYFPLTGSENIRLMRRPLQVRKQIDQHWSFQANPWQTRRYNQPTIQNSSSYSTLTICRWHPRLLLSIQKQQLHTSEKWSGCTFIIPQKTITWFSCHPINSDTSCVSSPASSASCQTRTEGSSRNKTVILLWMEADYFNSLLQTHGHRKSKRALTPRCRDDGRHHWNNHGF